ncbi:MAG: PAS domain S-box protein, partial [Burkholderiales bacterium]|nr:PAS domain S-box protein [Burkholderiales bacterium]
EILKPVLDAGKTVISQQAIHLPLLHSGQMLTIVGNAKGIFQAEEIGLLQQLARDISHRLSSLRERIEHRNRLMESEEKYRLILEHASDAVLIANPHGKFVYANQRAEQMLGYSAEELLSMDIPSITPADEIDHSIRLFELCQHEGHVSGEVMQKRKDGSTFPVEINAVRLPDGNYFGACRDITRRRRDEKAMRCQSHVLSHIDRGVCYMDEKEIILFTNAAFDAMFGYSPGELAGQHVYVLNDLDQVENEQFVTGVFSALQETDSWNGEVVNRRKDGTRFHTRAQVQRIRMGSETIYVTIQEDITERKHFERELLERRRKLQELHNMQLATHTASAIAHELNQPLFAIATYCEAALRMLESGKLEDRKLFHVLDSCAVQAQRAGSSIREMLHFLNDQTPPVENLDIHQEILSAISLVKSSNPLEFRTSVDPEKCLPPVRVNRIRIQKVLVNLLNNSVEAMESSGTKSPSVSLQVRKKAEMAQVSVIDNGPGLSEEEIRRIFEPFYTSRARGIGVGLSISRLLIEAQGGKLWADAGIGAAFHFTVPLALEDQFS